MVKPGFVAALLLGAASAQASVNFNVVFADTNASYASYYADLSRVAVAAGNDWISHFDLTQNSTLTVQIGFSSSISTANGASAGSHFVGTRNGLAVYEQSAAYEIKSGIDEVTGADILFTVSTNGYLQNELWFDPNPVAQSAAVPTTKTDARSVFLHEFGHAFGFNGFLDATSGANNGFGSTYDEHVERDVNADGGPTLFFTGANAVAEYGGAVPLTFGNYAHVGNNAPREGADLVGDLMNGVVYYRGTRYQISDLDLAIMQDVGLPVLAAVPEPETYALMLLGLVSLAALRRKRVFHG